MYLVAFLLVFVLLTFTLILLLSLYPIKAEALFNSYEDTNVHIVVSWLYPFLKATVIRESSELKLTLYLFSKKIYTRYLMPEKVKRVKGKERSYRHYISYVKTLELQEVKLNACYGFLDPSVTGMLCGAIDLISQLFKVEYFNNNADFICDTDYFNIEVSAKINIMASLIRILRNKITLPNHSIIKQG